MIKFFKEKYAYLNMTNKPDFSAKQDCLLEKYRAEEGIDKLGPDELDPDERFKKALICSKKAHDETQASITAYYHKVMQAGVMAFTLCFCLVLLVLTLMYTL